MCDFEMALFAIRAKVSLLLSNAASANVITDLPNFQTTHFLFETQFSGFNGFAHFDLERL